MALVVPFIQLLGYDPNLPREVRPEFTADFVQGDGKKFPDRMDYAIFDKTGFKPLMVIETKPLGTDLASKANQLARYVSQLADLHFGIITDGCHSYVRLSAKGRKLFEEIHERTHEFERSLSAMIGDEEMRSAALVLSKLRTFVEEHR